MANEYVPLHPVSSACESDPGRAAGHVVDGSHDSKGEHDSVHAQVTFVPICHICRIL